MSEMMSPEAFECLPNVRWSRDARTDNEDFLEQAWRGIESGKIEWRPVPVEIRKAAS